VIDDKSLENIQTFFTKARKLFPTFIFDFHQLILPVDLVDFGNGLPCNALFFTAKRNPEVR
jgi:hypothetical protein